MRRVGSVAILAAAVVGTVAPGAGLAAFRAVRVAPREMLAISCPSVRQCTAVGDSGLALTFDPRAPAQRRDRTIDAFHSLFGVACVSPEQCTVSANPGRVLTYAPAAPGRVTSRLLLPNTDYSTVACATRHRCVAIAGSREVTFDPLVPRRLIRGDLPSGNVSRVACPSATQCTAVDFNGSEVTFDPRFPRSPRPAVELDPYDLSSVSCPSVRQCTAIGGTSSDAITFDPRAPGAATATAVDANSQVGPKDVSCPSRGQCTLVDGDGREITFDPLSPGHPRPLKIPIVADVMAIACPSIRQCTVIGRRSELTFTPRPA
jgi:hypothetical protein